MSNTGYIHGTAPSEQERLAELNHLSNPAFIQFLDVHDGENVLEIGSGLGILAHQVSESARIQMTGIEIDQNQLQQAQLLKSDVAFLKGDAHNLPFDNSLFDRVYCRYVLEHVSNPQQVVDEAFRVLKPGGTFVCQENNIRIHETWPDCETYLHVWNRFNDLQSDLGGDALVGKKLFAMAKRSGFTHIQIDIHPEVYGYGEVGYSRWITNLIGLIDSAREALIDRKYCSSDEYHTAVQELKSLLTNEEGSVYFYWNRLMAVKPI